MNTSVARIESATTRVLPVEWGLSRQVPVKIRYDDNCDGENFVDWVYQAIDLDDKGHRLIYL